LKNLDEAVKQFVKVCYEKGIFDKLIKKNQSLIN